MKDFLEAIYGEAELFFWKLSRSEQFSEFLHKVSYAVGYQVGVIYNFCIQYFK